MDPNMPAPEPVSDYAGAKRWLWTHSDPETWMDDPDQPLPIEARLICDMFWITPLKLRKDMRALWEDIFDIPARRHTRSGWRAW